MKPKICLRKNSAIVSITTILIAGIIIGTAGTATYVYIENEKSGNIAPETVISEPKKMSTISQDKNEKPEEISLSSVKNEVKTLTDVDLNQYNDCFDDLNIKVYGMDVDHETILQQYIRKMKKDGYEILYEEERSEYNIIVKGIFGKSTLHGRGIAVIYGDPVTNQFGYETMLVTSNGYLTSYKKCADMVGVEI